MNRHNEHLLADWTKVGHTEAPSVTRKDEEVLERRGKKERQRGFLFLVCFVCLSAYVFYFVLILKFSFVGGTVRVRAGYGGGR